MVGGEGLGRQLAARIADDHVQGAHARVGGGDDAVAGPPARGAAAGRRRRGPPGRRARGGRGLSSSRRGCTRGRGARAPRRDRRRRCAGPTRSARAWDPPARLLFWAADAGEGGHRPQAPGRHGDGRHASGARAPGARGRAPPQGAGRSRGAADFPQPSKRAAEARAHGTRRARRRSAAGIARGYSHSARPRESSRSRAFSKAALSPVAMFRTSGRRSKMRDVGTRVIPVDPAAPDPAAVAEAVAVLRAGGLVAFPTETVYGLGGRALDAQAVARIFAAKGRPATHPLIAHVAGEADARPLAAAWPEAASAARAGVLARSAHARRPARGARAGGGGGGWRLHRGPRAGAPGGPRDRRVARRAGRCAEREPVPVALRDDGRARAQGLRRRHRPGDRRRPLSGGHRIDGPRRARGSAPHASTRRAPHRPALRAVVPNVVAQPERAAEGAVRASPGIDDLTSPARPPRRGPQSRDRDRPRRHRGPGLPHRPPRPRRRGNREHANEFRARRVSGWKCR